MFWALPKATGDKRAVHRAWYCLMWIWPCDSPGSMSWSRKRCCVSWFLVVHLGGAADSFLSLETVLQKSQALLKAVQTRWETSVSCWNHTCRILWSIKAWSKTVTITHSSVWFWFSFPTVGFPCCRNELILFFSLCLPWVLLSTAEGGGFGKHGSVTYLYDQIELRTRRGKI